jgi:hypothetical protein
MQSPLKAFIGPRCMKVVIVPRNTRSMPIDNISYMRSKNTSFHLSPWTVEDFLEIAQIEFQIFLLFSIFAEINAIALIQRFIYLGILKEFFIVLSFLLPPSDRFLSAAVSLIIICSIFVRIW